MNRGTIMNSESKKIYLAGFLATLVVLCAVLGFFYNSPRNENGNADSRFVDVQATGSVKVAPDALDLPISISATALSNQAATSQAAAAAARVRSAIAKYSISSSDISTTSLVTNPVYNYANNTSTLTGYQATQSLDLTIRNTSIAGTLIDAVVSAGGNSVAINGATPELINTDSANAKAERAAIAQAKIKALNYASGLGVKLGKVISLTESSNAPSPFPVMAFKADGSSSTAINLGTQTISVNIDARWSIAK